MYLYQSLGYILKKFSKLLVIMLDIVDMRIRMYHELEKRLDQKELT
jgi:hypothetical protein